MWKHFQLEITPIERFFSVPCCVFANEQISFPLQSDIFVGIVEKNLNNRAVDMGKFKRIETACSRTDHAGNVHSDMLSLV